MTDMLTSDVALGAPPPVDEHEVARVRASLFSRLVGQDDAPARIGRFALLEQIGQGGMGVVFAGYDGELDRKVAIKVIRRDRADASVQRRIIREAQAMAKLSHPNVAQVYEVGEDRGTTFIAMEFVRGVTLRGWQRERSRPWPEIVAIYVQAARGLAAAHAAGLVHRDFKPDNAIVSPQGVHGDHRVRVLDFGLARADAGEPTEEEVPKTVLPAPEVDALGTPLTKTGSLMGTPAYMAPEQFLGERVDAKSDQFALCVALWEALFGERPFAGETRADLVANVTRGRLRVPPKTSGVPAWVRAVLAMGLSPAPSERHRSMGALVAALQNDPSRRRRRAVLAAVSVGLLGLGVAVWALDRAQRSRACEQEGRAIAEIWNDDARARTRAALLGTGISFAASSWARIEPRLDAYALDWAHEAETVCRTIELDTGATAVQGATVQCLADRRAALSTLIDTFAEAGHDATILRGAAQAAASLPEIRACVEDAEMTAGALLPEDTETRARIRALRDRLAESSTLRLAGRPQRALEIAEQLVPEADALGWTPLRVDVRARLGSLQRILGRRDQMGPTLREAFALAVRDGYDRPLVAILAELVATENTLGNSERALWWGTLAEALAERLDQQQSPAMATLLTTYGAAKGALGDDAAEQALHERSLAIAEAVLGPDHPSTAKILGNLSDVERQRGDFVRAREHVERSLAIKARALGPDHPDVGTGWISLGNFLASDRDYVAARSALERGLGILEPAFGPDHLQVGQAMSSLAGVLHESDEWIEARRVAERAVAIVERAAGPDHRALADAVGNLANILHTLGEYDAAIAAHQRTIAIRERAFGPESAEVAKALGNLGNAYGRAGRLDDQIATATRALAIYEKVYGPEHPSVAHVLRNLASGHREAGDAGRALELGRRALAIFEKVHGPSHSQVGETLSVIGDAELELDRLADAEAHLERALAICAAVECRAEVRVWIDFGLARARWPRAADRADAIALAREARALAARTAAPRRDDPRVVAIDAWLAAPGRR